MPSKVAYLWQFGFFFLQPWLPKTAQNWISVLWILVSNDLWYYISGSHTFVEVAIYVIKWTLGSTLMHRTVMQQNKHWLTMQDDSAFLKRNKTNFTITINLNGWGGRMTIAIGRSFWWVATLPMQQTMPTSGIRVNFIDAHGVGYGGFWVESLGDFHKSVVL